MTGASLVMAAALIVGQVQSGAADGATVEGSVLMAASDGPLAGAVVRLPGLDRETRSDAEGGFAFQGVPSGRWRLEAHLEGYRPAGFTVEVPETGAVRVVLELTSEPAEPESRRTGTIRGTVRAGESLEPVPYAGVEGRPAGPTVAADQRGFFVLSGLEAGIHTLRIAAPGFRPVERAVRVLPGEAATVTVPLEPAPLEVEGVEVEGRTEDVEGGSPGTSFARVTAELIDHLPAAAETDVLRSVQLLPSVQPISDFSSALYLRGGSSDQTLITLDGAPIFNPYHLGGIFSAVDPDAVATVDVHPGALPAGLGDRLSGAVEIWTREGGRDRLRGRGGVSLVSTRAGLDGPMPVGDGTFLLSLRRTYLDLLTTVADWAGLLARPLPYHFTDAHLKVTRPLGATGTLTGSFYVDSEELTNRDPTATGSSDLGGDDHFVWGSRVFSLSHRQLLGERTLLEVRGAFSSFRGEVDFFDTRRVPGSRELQVVRTVEGRTYTRDALASGGITRYGRDHQLRAGAQVDGYLLDYDVDRSDGFYEDILPAFRSRDELTTVSGYLEGEWRPDAPVSVRLGGRVLAGGGDAAWMPRIGVDLRLGPSLALRVGGGRYAQALQSLRNDEASLASLLAYDLLVPVDSRGFPRSWDGTVGLDWRTEGVRIEVTGYLKELENLPMAPLPRDPDEAPVIAVEGFDRGSGRTLGLEASARWEWSPTGTVRLSYTLASARRTLDGQTFTPRFHRRHFVDLLATRGWGDRGSLSARLVAASGQPFTPPVGRFADFVYDPATGRYQEGFGAFLRGEHNGARLPGYWRVDVSARRDFEKDWFGRRVTLTPYLQITNLLNTRNVLYAQPQDNFADEEVARLEYLPMIPILPTFGLEWRF